MITSSFFSEKFVLTIADLLKNYIDPVKIDKFLNQLERVCKTGYFSPAVEYNIERILETNYDRIGFVFDSFRYPHYLEILFQIASSSNFLTEIVIKNPEYLHFVLKPENLSIRVDLEKLTAEVKSEVQKFRTFSSRLNILKSIKKRYTLKIGVQDILGIVTFDEVTEQISILARVLLSELFDCSIIEISQKFNFNPPKTKHCLFALGKLGGGELNYSSDVDLMIIFDKNSRIGREKKIEYYDFMSDVIQLFSSSSSNINEKGFLYRIDFRLRPDGKNSPLCRTYSDTIKYYETRGEDWERQMLIKTGFINGDKKLYEKFKSYLKPYIFPSTHSSSPLKLISRMKKNIEHQFPDENNIKLCEGGIRDIEFLIQAFQLINGGLYPELHTGHSLKALAILEAKNIFTKNEAKKLRTAYIFYRRIEHFLQLENDQQTHTIPTNEETLEKLSYYLELPSSTEILKTVTEFKSVIKKMFDSFTNQKTKTKQPDLFSNITFSDFKRADNNYNFIKKGISSIGQKSFDSKTINLFSNFENSLLKYLANCTDPDRVLANFAKVLRNISFPSIFYFEFQNIKFLKLFLILCEYSQRAIDMMSVDKSLIDFFLTRRVFSNVYEALYIQLDTKKFIFLISVQLALKLINAAKASQLISEFLSKKISLSVEEKNINHDFFIAGLGSFGTKEMNFASDADLFFVSNKIENTFDLQKDFSELVDIINKKIDPFKLDLRLRPEGNKGPLVWDINKLKKYFVERARVWEFQSMHKLRLISGNKLLFNEFKKLVSTQLKNYSKKEISDEISAMRTSMKKSRMIINTIIDVKSENGGINDISFYIDQLLLPNPKLFYSEIGKERSRILTKLNETKLSDLYKKIRTIELLNQNINNVNYSKLSTNQGDNELLCEFIGLNKINFIDEFKNEIVECFQIIKKTESG